MLAVTRVGARLTLCLDRPEVHNAFDAALIASLTEALRGAGEDPRVRVVVLAGSGKSFSAGADLNWMQAMAGYTETENLRDAEALATLMRTLAYLPKPTLARVHGSAFGGGVGLVACCDVALALPGARFALTETRLGLVPAVISPYVVDAIGLRQALRYFQTAEAFDAVRAAQIGLVHEVLPDEPALDAAVDRLCGQLLQTGPQALAEAKTLARRVAGRELARQQAQDAENAALIARLRVGAEGQEGLRAFLEKRAASFVCG